MKLYESIWITHSVCTSSATVTMKKYLEFLLIRAAFPKRLKKSDLNN